MITAYKQGKDLYATIASGVYKMGYWDCMEHHEDGSPNPEGKKRRQSVKAILLGRPKRFHCFHVKYLCPFMQQCMSNNDVNRDYKRVYSRNTMLTVNAYLN